MQQGDLLGPVLFALAVHPAIMEARAATETSHLGGIDLFSFFIGSTEWCEELLGRRIAKAIALLSPEALSACYARAGWSKVLYSLSHRACGRPADWPPHC